MSCYKHYDPAPYSIAVDRCFRLVSKQHYIKRPYLVNIESKGEMDFVMSIMDKNNIKELYVGANNIVKRSKFPICARIYFVSS